MKHCPFCGKKLLKYDPAVFMMWYKYCKKCQIGFRYGIEKEHGKIHWDKFEHKI